MYKSLYRRYRPKTFDDVVGQEKIVEVLKNQIKTNRVGHAYLFNGVRGTGKTSIAKIFALALNCQNLKDGNPCNECEHCKSILSGNNVDVIEMDAASNNGVDDIRIIKDEIGFTPTSLKYRVYIIDEVHMLSGGAYNALLKTSEEPPEHVKFILATTEIQKLPATILSRCQRFEFLRIDEKKIQKQLTKISKECNISISEEALCLISNLANGSMRDGISILESVSNIDGKITQKEVREIVGIPDFCKVAQVFENILLSNTNEVIKISNEILDSGKEPLSYITEILKIVEAIYLQEETILNTYTEEEKNIIKKFNNIDKLEMYKIIKDILDLISNMKYMENKKVMLVAGLINISEKNKNNKYINESLKIIGYDKKENTELIKRQLEENIENDEIFTPKEKEVNLSKIEEIKKKVESSEGIIKTNNKLTDEIISDSEKKEVNNEVNLEKNKNIESKQVEQKEKTEQKEEKSGNIENNIENKKINKNNEEIEGLKTVYIDTLELRKKMLAKKQTQMFVALINIQISYQYSENFGIIKLNVSKEKTVEKLEVLNNEENLEILKQAVIEILDEKQIKVEKDTIKVDFIF